MAKVLTNKIKLNVCNGVIIEMTQFSDGSFILERNKGEKWFVASSLENGCFHLQENLENGEIDDICDCSNMVETLYKMAWL